MIGLAAHSCATLWRCKFALARYDAAVGVWHVRRKCPLGSSTEVHVRDPDVCSGPDFRHKDHVPAQDHTGESHLTATRRRRPLPLPRIGLNSSIVFCQAVISSAYQIRLFGEM
jgi:hypothetical protein